MRKGNLYMPGGSDEAACIFSDRLRSGSGNTRGSVIIDSGAFYSGGTGEDGIIVSTGGLSSIEEVSAPDMLAVAGGGALVSDLKEAVEDKGLFFPAGDICTRGITLAQLIDEACVSDLRRVYGGVREYILSMELITPGGQLITSGSRSVKDVAGYDLTGFCFGSLGRCGLISRAAVRLLQAPRLRQVHFYSCGIERSAEVSLEINREAGPVCQYLFLDRAASMISEAHTGSGYEPGEAEAVLAVRVESESERGLAGTVERLEGISERAGMDRLFTCIGEARLPELFGRLFAGSNPCECALHISYDTVPEFKRSPVGITWYDLYPGRVHLLLPLHGSEPLGLDGAGEYGRDIIRAMKQDANSLRVELLERGKGKLPLGTNYIKNILSGGEPVAVDQLIKGMDTPFSLREYLDKRVEEPVPARRNEVEKTEAELYRLFDPGSLILER
ncbi:MAG: FAD-binding oxidoreductase [Candidatus Krumholzibacteriales bacterium]